MLIAMIHPSPLHLLAGDVVIFPEAPEHPGQRPLAMTPYVVERRDEVLCVSGGDTVPWVYALDYRFVDGVGTRYLEVVRLSDAEGRRVPLPTIVPARDSHIAPPKSDTQFIIGPTSHLVARGLPAGTVVRLNAEDPLMLTVRPTDDEMGDELPLYDDNFTLRGLYLLTEGERREESLAAPLAAAAELSPAPQPESAAAAKVSGHGLDVIASAERPGHGGLLLELPGDQGAILLSQVYGYRPSLAVVAQGSFLQKDAVRPALTLRTATGPIEIIYDTADNRNAAIVFLRDALLRYGQ